MVVVQLLVMLLFVSKVDLTVGHILRHLCDRNPRSPPLRLLLLLLLMVMVKKMGRHVLHLLLIRL